MLGVTNRTGKPLHVNVLVSNTLGQVQLVETTQISQYGRTHVDLSGIQGVVLVRLTATTTQTLQALLE